MAKYLYNQPTVVQAFQFYVDTMPDWFMDKVSSNEVILRNCDYNKHSIDEAYCEIKNLKGAMRVIRGGDYIIKGLKDKIYYCNPDMFDVSFKLYEN